MTREETTPVGRRQFLRTASAAGVGALSAGQLSAGQLSAAVGPTSGPGAGLFAPTDDFMAQARANLVSGMCNATASDVEGPFFADLQLLRNDITEGQAGLQMFLFLQIIDAPTCTPIPNAIVDVWQCDSEFGKYSGYPSEGTAGETWLRGTQITPLDGVVWFKTVFPGWYPGRTAHVHVKARFGNKELTTQLYFDDFISQAVYAALPPYTAHGPAPVSNAQDGFFNPDNVSPVIVWPPGQVSLLSGFVVGVV